MHLFGIQMLASYKGLEKIFMEEIKARVWVCIQGNNNYYDNYGES